MSSSAYSKSESDDIRARFPHTGNGLIYLNHAAISPLPQPVYEAARECLDVRNSGAIENFEKGEQIVNEARSMVAGYINAGSAEQITFMGNTSDALSAVAEGLTWQEGDEIILNTLEFPSNVQPFRRLEKQGVRLKYVRAEQHSIRADDIEKLITPETRLVSVSAVQYLSGFRADLKAIGKLCSENDLLFVVDGIQALGAAAVNVKECGIDALCTGGHKWLMAPMGIGFLYLSNRLQKVLEPFKTGWLSVEDPWNLSKYDQPWLPVSQHLETGTPNFIGISGLGASISHFEDAGIESVEQQIQYLSGALIDQLQSRKNTELITPISADNRLGIVAFSVKGVDDYGKIVEKLKKEKITISARENYFRISPHFYNTEKEIDQTLKQLFSLL